jgi:hypothetical protein
VIVDGFGKALWVIVIAIATRFNVKIKMTTHSYRFRAVGVVALIFRR